jgi:hypothetical protein
VTRRLRYCEETGRILLFKNSEVPLSGERLRSGPGARRTNSDGTCSRVRGLGLPIHQVGFARLHSSARLNPALLGQ